MDTAYDVTDYTNLRCVDNYTYDSGWKYDGGNYCMSQDSTNGIIFNGSRICSSTSGKCGNGYSNGGYTYYYGSITSINEYGYTTYNVKQTQPRINYKAFSSF